jgi:hypothetical protein
VGDDQPCRLGRIVELAVADRSERQVAERAAPFPALVARLSDDALRLGRGIEAVERLEPLDPGEPVPALAAALGVQEVIGERARIGGREAECT